MSAWAVVLAADEDEGVAGVGGQRRDRDPLDQLVRVALHQLAVLEGARLGLVGVAAEVLRHVAAGQEGGLFAHREAGAAAAAQSPSLRAPGGPRPAPSRGRPSPASRSRRSPCSPRSCAAPGPRRARAGRASQASPRLPVGGPISRLRGDIPAHRARSVAGQWASLQRLIRQHLFAGFELRDRRPRLGRFERAVVALVDRRHRRDVAGAEALEAGDEEVVLARRRRPRRRRAARRRRASSS